MTGGGVRALGKRVWASTENRMGRYLMDHPRVTDLASRTSQPFPPFTRYLDRLSTLAGPEVRPNLFSAGLIRRRPPSKLAALTHGLPASARPVFFRLLTAVDRRAAQSEER